MNRPCVYCSINAHDKCTRKNCSCAHLERNMKDTMHDPNKKGPILEFQWGDLPPRTAPNGIVERLTPSMEKLKERPGKWAKIADYNSHSGANSTGRILRNSGFSEYEYTSRRTYTDPKNAKKGTSALWVRYVGKTAAKVKTRA